VIEPGFCPLLLVVTAFTLGTQVPLVPLFIINFLMTVIAQLGCLTELELGQMAAFAFAFLVSTQQLELSATVIEFFLVQGGNIGSTALVLDVAKVATGVVQFAVQSPFSTDIGGYVLVAIKAKSGLRLFVKTLMALFAFILVLGMP